MNIKKNLITGALVATSLLAVVPTNVLAEEPQVTSSITFPDVPSTHWAKDDIYSLVDLGYVAGYANGTYGLNDDVTRGQAAAILSRWLKDTGKLTTTEVSNPFADVSNDYWAKDDILQVVNAGYMVGKGNGVFDPKATVTRAEMATILTNVLDTEKKADSPFDDVTNHWGKEYIDNAYSNELVHGMGNNKYIPDGNVTRAQFATFIMNGVNWTPTVEEPVIEPPVVEEPVEDDSKYYGDEFLKDLVENDEYNVVADDVKLPKSEEAYESVFKNEEYLNFLTPENLKIIADTNETYGTNYQITDLHYKIVIAEGDEIYCDSVRILRFDDAYSFAISYDHTDPIESHIALALLDNVAPNLYEQIEGSVVKIADTFDADEVPTSMFSQSKSAGTLTGYNQVSMKILPYNEDEMLYLYVWR